MEAKDLLNEVLKPSEEMLEWINRKLIPGIKSSPDLEFKVNAENWDAHPEDEAYRSPLVAGLSKLQFVLTLRSLGYDVEEDSNTFREKFFIISLKTASEHLLQ